MSSNVQSYQKCALTNCGMCLKDMISRLNILTEIHNHSYKQLMSPIFDQFSREIGVSQCARTPMPFPTSIVLHQGVETNALWRRTLAGNLLYHTRNHAPASKPH